MIIELIDLCPEDWTCKPGQKKEKDYPGKGPFKKIVIKAKHMQDLNAIPGPHDSTLVWIEAEI